MLNTVEFTVKDKTYKLRMTTRNVIRLERDFKKNPLSIFMKVEQDELPTTDELLKVLYYSLCAYHEADFLKFDNVYELYDEYLEEGGSFVDLINVVVEVFKVSGLIPKEEGIESKN